FQRQQNLPRLRLGSHQVPQPDPAQTVGLDAKPRADETGEENPARTNGRKNAPKRTGINSCLQKCRLKPETGLQTAFV
ncbi:hypothetical protein ACM37_00315, partial [Helicobacter pylori]